MTERVLILDFGAQYTQLIARRLREQHVYCEIHPCTVGSSFVRQFEPAAVILSGGPASTTEEASPRAPQSVFELGVPVLGICYGEQTMCAQLGGKVESGHHREFGRALITLDRPSPLFDGLLEPGDQAPVWMSHGDRVTALPPGFVTIAHSDGAPFAAIADDERRFYGVQFHPEVIHTAIGAGLLRNFLYRVASSARRLVDAGLPRGGDPPRPPAGRAAPASSAASPAASIPPSPRSSSTRPSATSSPASSSTPASCATARPPRWSTSSAATSTSPSSTSPLPTSSSASSNGITDPERKRKLIGGTFIDVFEAEAKKIPGVGFLAQGTLYPDVIESVSFHGPSVTIKSHHNVGGLPERMALGLVEPLRELFKDEVRELGRELGLPEPFITRHPFPGPGLAVRIPGEVTPDRVRLLQQADRIFLDEIRAAGLYDAIWQAFAVLLPVRTVGVMGDLRTYEAACALRAVTSQDGMTADFYPFEPAFLGRVANRIVNEVRGINRVVYDCTSKPPGTIEWE